MLTIEIFEEPKVKKGPTLMLNNRVHNGAFQVFACYADGAPLPCGILWSLEPDGSQICRSGIRTDLGLDLDADRRIRSLP